MTNEKLEQLRADCELAAKFWGRTFSALGAMTYREKGEAAIKKLWVLLLGQHQGGFYRQGLKKLGLTGHEPPAIAAGKYHYLTNLIGGLDMEYVEESPQKVWIRYTAPMWTYAGITMLAIPGSLRRTIFTGWHPHNGRMMGCARLGWVSTKFIMEGEPYDEGYFMEYGHDLAPGEEMRYEIATYTPEFDPSKAPKLDRALWPDTRIFKARRNWSREYVNTTIDCLFQMFGESVTLFLLQQTMRCFAIQYTHELKRDMGINGRDAKAVTSMFTRLLQACDQEFEVEQVNDSKHRITLYSFKPFRRDTASEGIRAASFNFQQTAARLINGRLSVTRKAEPARGIADREIWEIEDTGRWLW